MGKVLCFFFPCRGSICCNTASSHRARLEARLSSTVWGLIQTQTTVGPAVTSDLISSDERVSPCLAGSVEKRSRKSFRQRMNGLRGRALLAEACRFSSPGLHVKVSLGKILNPKLLLIAWQHVWITVSCFGQKRLRNAYESFTIFRYLWALPENMWR